MAIFPKDILICYFDDDVEHCVIHQSKTAFLANVMKWGSIMSLSFPFISFQFFS